MLMSLRENARKPLKSANFSGTFYKTSFDNAGGMF
jgi:hypothetical protein